MHHFDSNGGREAQQEQQASVRHCNVRIYVTAIAAAERINSGICG